MAIDKLFDKIIEAMLDENTETIAGFLGYKPDDEVLSTSSCWKKNLVMQ